MRPGKEYTLQNIAKLHEIPYYMIILDDTDGMSGTITAFSSFKELKTAFLEKIKKFPDDFDDAYIGSQGKTYSYSANLGEGSRIEIEIGDLNKKEMTELGSLLSSNRG